MNSIILIRGLPGSGKTTLAKTISDSVEVCANDFFGTNENYDFDPSKLSEAHEWCKINCELWCEKNDVSKSIVIHNTFTERWEMQPYIEYAQGFGRNILVIDLFDSGLSDAELFERGIHDVPLSSIKRMRDRYEKDWKNSSVKKSPRDLSVAAIKMRAEYHYKMSVNPNLVLSTQGYHSSRQLHYESQLNKMSTLNQGL